MKSERARLTLGAVALTLVVGLFGGFAYDAEAGRGTAAKKRANNVRNRKPKTLAEHEAEQTRLRARQGKTGRAGKADQSHLDHRRARRDRPHPGISGPPRSGLRIAPPGPRRSREPPRYVPDTRSFDYIDGSKYVVVEPGLEAPRELRQVLESAPFDRAALRVVVLHANTSVNKEAKRRFGEQARTPFYEFRGSSSRQHLEATLEKEFKDAPLLSTHFRSRGHWKCFVAVVGHADGGNIVVGPRGTAEVPLSRVVELGREHGCLVIPIVCNAAQAGAGYGPTTKIHANRALQSLDEASSAARNVFDLAEGTSAKLSAPWAIGWEMVRDEVGDAENQNRQAFEREREPPITREREVLSGRMRERASRGTRSRPEPSPPEPPRPPTAPSPPRGAREDGAPGKDPSVAKPTDVGLQLPGGVILIRVPGPRSVKRIPADEPRGRTSPPVVSAPAASRVPPSREPARVPRKTADSDRWSTAATKENEGGGVPVLEVILVILGVLLYIWIRRSL